MKNEVLLTTEQVDKFDFSNDFFKLRIDLTSEFRETEVTIESMRSWLNNYIVERNGKVDDLLVTLFKSLNHIFQNLNLDTVENKINTNVELLISRKCDCYTIVWGKANCWVDGAGVKHCWCNTTGC